MYVKVCEGLVLEFGELEVHPVVTEVSSHGVTAVSFDDLPEFFSFFSGEWFFTGGGHGVSAGVDIDGNAPGVNGVGASAGGFTFVIAAAIFIEAEFFDFGGCIGSGSL